ncbi:Uncharacterised protein [Shigella sonnei]|nr:Uncharacterised protein [Shigella sonnei]
MDNSVLRGDIPFSANEFSSVAVSSHTVTASVARLWLFLPPDAVLLNIPGLLPRWHTVHRYAAGLPLFCRIRTTPGNYRKHRPEALRCNRPDDSVDGYLSGPVSTRTRPPEAFPNRRYGHHERRPTAGQSLFYRCPAPGPERGYHRHGLYRASAHTGAGCHTAVPAVQQQHLSSAPVWHGSAPRPDDGIFLTGGITADSLHIFQRQHGPEAPLRHNCVQWVLKAPVPARYGHTGNRPVSDVVFR